jgi:ABC-type ATPase involved in cell division
MIQFENVTATYADDVGIFDLSFHIEKGEMVNQISPHHPHR